MDMTGLEMKMREMAYNYGLFREGALDKTDWKDNHLRGEKELDTKMTDDSIVTLRERVSETSGLPSVIISCYWGGEQAAWQLSLSPRSARLDEHSFFWKKRTLFRNPLVEYEVEREIDDLLSGYGTITYEDYE